MSFFKPSWLFRKTVLNLIDEQIADASKAHIANQCTAEHYQALANGNAVTLARLRLQRAAEVEAAAPKPAKPPKVRTEPVTETVATTVTGKSVKLRAAS